MITRLLEGKMGVAETKELLLWPCDAKTTPVGLCKGKGTLACNRSVPIPPRLESYHIQT
jgi:hypothetical protein